MGNHDSGLSPVSYTPPIAMRSSPAENSTPPGPRLHPSSCGIQLPQGPLEVWEVAGAERLDPGVVVAIEPSHCARAPRPPGGIRRTEPQPKVERVDRLGRRVLVGIGERRLIMDDGRRLVPRGLRHDECLDAEAADEPLVAVSLIVGLDGALIPGHPEGRIGKLDHKEVELRIRRQPRHLHVHHLDRSPRLYLYMSAGTRQAVAVYGRG